LSGRVDARGSIGPVQPSRDRYWYAHIALGFVILAGQAGVSIAYFAVSPDGPARGTLQSICGCAVGVALVELYASRRIARWSWREGFVAVNAIASIGVLSLCAHMDGGLESPLLYLSVLPVVHLGLFASPSFVAASSAASVGAVTVIGVIDPDVKIPQESLLMLVAFVVSVAFLATLSSIHRSRLQTAHAALVEVLFRRGETDELTGCFNYRAFHERLADEIDRAMRYGRPLSVIVCDVDHFRDYNEMYGHDRGDATLAAVGAHLRSCSRASDVVARVGGDEFGILLPESTLDLATAVAGRMAALAVDDPMLPTLSIGVAALRPDDPTAKRLFRDADRAMYVAKRSGRGRAFAATEDVSGDRAAVVPAQLRRTELQA